MRVRPRLPRPCEVAAACAAAPGDVFAREVPSRPGGVGGGPAVRYLEELVETRTKPYQRSTYRRLREEARVEGIEVGEVKTLIRVLLETSGMRGIRLTAAQRRRVESCTDAELLHEWFRRAVSATTAEQIFA
ncbi:hypothetical protein GCM10023223_53230 [Stackebrandtia albiflava]